MTSLSTPDMCTVTANGFTKRITSCSAAFNTVFVKQNKNTVEKREEILLETNKEERVDTTAGNWFSTLNFFHNCIQGVSRL